MKNGRKTRQRALTTLGAVCALVLSGGVMADTAAALEAPDSVDGASITSASGFSVSVKHGPVTFGGVTSAYPWVGASTVSNTRVMDPSLAPTPVEALNAPELVAWGFEKGQAALQITTAIPQLESASTSERRAFSPFNDFDWHDWANYELAFSQPIADPVLRVNSVPVAMTTTGRRAASFASTFGVASATTASGASVPVDVKDPTGTLASAYTIDNNSVFPADRKNQLPFAMGMCDTSQTVYTPPASSTSEQFLQDSRVYFDNPDLEFITNPCGTIKIDTGGVPVTSLSMRYFLQSYRLGEGGTSSFLFDAFIESTIQSFAVEVHNEVSGSPAVIPASYGAASHVVSSSKLGSEIVPAFEEDYLTEARSGTAETNSDSGYDAVTAEQLNAAFAQAMPGKSVSVSVPLSGVDKDATVSAWVDFDGSGDFSEAEIATASVQPGATSANLTWTVPSQFRSGTTYLRLRIGHTSEQVMVPTGMADSGEVEDHAFVLPAQPSTPDPKPTPEPKPTPDPDPTPPVSNDGSEKSRHAQLAETGADNGSVVSAGALTALFGAGLLFLRHSRRKRA